MRGDAIIATVTPKGQQSKHIMAENTVTMAVDASVVLDLQINDYVDVFVNDATERYFLLDLDDVKKASSIEFNHTIIFKGWQYKLQPAAYLFPDSDNNFTLAGQTIMGNLETFIDLLITNANRDQTGWVKGVIDETDFQEFTPNVDDNCLSVLASLATAFKTEWWVNGQTIHMTKRGDIEDITYMYGQGNGLYDLTRTTSTDKNIVTRLYAYGSTRNIPANYKGFSDKLKLPGTTPYLEKNVWIDPADHSLGYKYGVIENIQVFEEIYPHRTGLVTAVGADDFTFIDSEIDFNVNDQLLGEGVNAQITFNTGLLSGYTFDVHTFDNATKTFVINQNQDEKAFIVPNDDFKPAIGDQYVITNIAMPDTYIAAAEAELLAAAQSYLDENCNPIVSYAVTCDPINFKQRGIVLTLGNYVHVTDADFNLDADIRVTGFTRDLQIPSQYTMELAEVVSISPIVRQVVQNENLVKKVTRVGKSTNLAYNNALQAKATAEGVKKITDFWGVTIDPDAGLIASGTLLVGSGALNNAGITGVIDEGPDSVRFWAGAPYADKDTAPFRVLDNGKMYATNAEISGKITASEGKIGPFTITDEGLENISTSHAYIRHVKMNTDGVTVDAQAVLGTTSVPFFGDNYIGYFANNEPGNEINNALLCQANGGSVANYALTVLGGIYVNGNTCVTDQFSYEVDGSRYKFTFVEGLLVKQEPD